MKTYNIMLSQFFPSWHPRTGDKTLFKEHLRQQKLHTIRANVSHWQGIFKEIADGEAVLVARQWIGRPYRSKTFEIARFDADCGIGLQTLTFEESLYGLHSINRPLIDGRPIRVELLAANDGLSYEDWASWFQSYDLSEPMAVIQFTNFRY